MGGSLMGWAPPIVETSNRQNLRSYTWLPHRRSPIYRRLAVPPAGLTLRGGLRSPSSRHRTGRVCVPTPGGLRPPSRRICAPTLRFPPVGARFIGDGRCHPRADTAGRPAVTIVETSNRQSLCSYTGRPPASIAQDLRSYIAVPTGRSPIYRRRRQPGRVEHAAWEPDLSAIGNYSQMASQ
jgi:hypothetical protein